MVPIVPVDAMDAVEEWMTRRTTKAVGGGVSAPAATTAQAAPCHVGGIGIHEGFRWVGAEQP